MYLHLDHLPVLGRTSPVAVVVDSASQIVASKPSNKPDENLRFSVGDKVAVNISLEVLKQIQVVFEQKFKSMTKFTMVRLF